MGNKKQKIERTCLYTSSVTKNQLRLLSVISGLSVAKIIKLFASAATPISLKHQAEGCTLEFGNAEDIVLIKFLKKR